MVEDIEAVIRARVSDGKAFMGDAGVIAVGDLGQGDWVKLIELTTRPSMVYVDPPWGPGLNTTFRKAATTHIPLPALDYDEMIEALVSQIVAGRPDHVFIEMGDRWADHLDERAIAAGLDLKKRWRITYYKTKPATLAYYVLRGAEPHEFKTSARAMDDSMTPGWAMTEIPYGVVGDPCLGLGATALNAIKLSRRFIGMDINPARLARAHETIQKRAPGGMALTNLKG